MSSMLTKQVPCIHVYELATTAFGQDECSMADRYSTCLRVNNEHHMETIQNKRDLFRKKSIQRANYDIT